MNKTKFSTSRNELRNLLLCPSKRKNTTHTAPLQRWRHGPGAVCATLNKQLSQSSWVRERVGSVPHHAAVSLSLFTWPVHVMIGISVKLPLPPSLSFPLLLSVCSSHSAEFLVSSFSSPPSRLLLLVSSSSSPPAHDGSSVSIPLLLCSQVVFQQRESPPLSPLSFFLFLCLCSPGSMTWGMCVCVCVCVCEVACTKIALLLCLPLTLCDLQFQVNCRQDLHTHKDTAVVASFV